IVKTPAGLTRTITTTRTATLANPNDLFSLTKLTDTVTDNGAINTHVYNGTSRLLTSTSATGRTSTANLDSQGRVTQQKIAGIEPVTYTYDSRGLLSNITEGSGTNIRTANFVHNAAGDLTSASDALGQTVNIAYDSVGRVVTQKLPDSSITQYSYDAAGNVTAITPPGRLAHAFAYTPIDQVSAYTPPNLDSGSTATQYSYNVDRGPTHITRPDGNIIDIAYDTGGRPTSLGIARGLFNYSYNATTSQLTGVTSPGELGLTYSYDGTLPTGVTWSGAVTGATAYTYNNLLLASTESVNAANTVSFNYDADGLLKTAGNLALTRNTQNGLLTGSTLGNVTDSMTYNTLAELTNYSANYTTTGIYNVAYSHDAVSRITQKVETISGTPVTYGYSYDNAGRLSAVTKDTNPLSTYSYDSNGNRTASTRLNGTVSASYDAQDRLTSYGSNTYSYTANGELLSKTVGAQTTSYQYDAIGNLLNVTLPDGTAIDYLIDGENRRIGKKVNGTLVQAFLYQGRLRPVAELNSANAIVSRFVYATHINVPDYIIKAGVTYRIIADNLGSPRLVMNTSTGVVVQRIDYDEFGNVIADSNPGFQPFGFAGGLYDRNTRLVRFGARDYDAEVGRWTAKDPILFEGGDRNLYAYVGGSPISFIDPFGLAQFGKRPLDGMPYMVNSPMDNYFNTEISHEQIFYGDGKKPSNEGFFGDGKVRPDATKNIPNYTMGGPHYDDTTMRDAVAEAKKVVKPYCLIRNNCQDFADKVRKEYERQQQKKNSCQK
ncbi:MAG: RHS repeat-associated core domain-containing protein, partial [Candidatus Nitrotoga sp.]